ncbi:MAG: SUMF1/EgtB/PvdO family nonheme iron enzyme [Polyangiaceae bacterium]
MKAIGDRARPVIAVVRAAFIGCAALVEGAAFVRCAALVGCAALAGCATGAPVETVVVAVPTSPPAPKPAQTAAPPACPVGMTLIAGGSLPANGRGIEVADFCLDVTEVTAGAYALCVGRGACDADDLSCDEAPTYGRPDLQAHPINCVSWEQASRYCQSEKKRLPTFEEWEWAAGAQGEHRKFAWGEDPPGDADLCWSRGAVRTGTCIVGGFPASRTPQGVDDLFGNVWEWLAPETRSSAPNIARGGSWSNDTLDMLESDGAGAFLPGFVRNDVVGFRCAAAAPRGK